MFKKIATWIHLASGGGIKQRVPRPEIFIRRKAEQPIILFALYRKNGGFRLTRTDAGGPSDVIHVGRLCEDALIEVFRKQGWIR